MPRAPHEPTPASRKQVEALAAYGIPQDAICKVVGVSLPTLHKHYRDELDTAMSKANARVAESLFKKATGDGTQSVTAAIFWLKTRAGWKETVVNEHAGQIKHEMNADDAFKRFAQALDGVATGAARDPDETI